MMSCTGGANARPLYAYASARHPGALADITNVSLAKAGKMEKAQQIGQPPLQPQPLQQELSTAAEDVVHVNVQDAKEYGPDFYSTLFNDESAFLPRPNYMDAQSDITAKMRAILIDWLSEVHMKYKLRPETLHLTVNLIDRYLTRMPVMRKRLQLVGVAAMFIASKFEEIHPPALRDFVHITDNAYTKEDVLVMECSMLTAMNFQVMVPTAAHFFEGMTRANGCSQLHRDVVQYILELSLLDISMLHHTPSQVVSAAILLSNELLGRSPIWPRHMVQESRNSDTTLRGCVEELRQLLKVDQAGNSQLQAVRKKFSVPQRNSVATKTF
jgi:cyclin B